ncbi:MAG: ABC transporter permease [Treponema sp.]|jgi:simple sugar transport system permease protein|nr:ABC transporter permease [Treponema sp.]
MRVRIIQRAELDPRREALLRLGAVAAALGASALVMLCMGYNPALLYARIVEGSLGSAYRFRETVHKAIPLAMLSLGTAVAFRMRFWNIGAEGQFYMGAFGASALAFAFPGLPAPLLLSIMLVSAFVFAGLWALIPALLKLRWGTNETLVTLMLNYVAQKWITFLQYGPWKDPQGIGFPKIAAFGANAVLPATGGVHIGWLLTLAAAGAVWFILKKTKLGFEIAVLGGSETTARYAGLNVFRVCVTAALLSGGLCGAAGMLQASGIERSLSDQLSGGLGFTAVITTWLGHLNPPAVLAVSFAFSMLIQGGNFLQSALQIPQAISQILQGIIIFFVLGAEFFLRYTFVIERKKG